MLIVFSGRFIELYATGWGLQAIQSIFLSRTWATDEKVMKEKLAFFTETNFPLQLLLFPEGTDLSDSNKEKSHQYANANGLQKYDYVLHPRNKGFCLCLKELRKGKVPPTIVNISIGYVGTIPQNEKDISNGNWPTEIHFFAEQFASSNLPCDEEGLTQWLQECWEEKEEQLKQFYKDKKFHAKYMSDTEVRNSYGEMKKIMFLWSMFLAYIGYNFITNWYYWIYYPVFTTFYLLLNYFTNGVDSIILKRHRLFRK